VSSAYRDHDDGLAHGDGVRAYARRLHRDSDLTRDHNALVAWLSRVTANGGGQNDGEAVERALDTVPVAEPEGMRPPEIASNVRMAGLSR
jgi:hypothetical protein